MYPICPIESLKSTYLLGSKIVHVSTEASSHLGCDETSAEDGGYLNQNQSDCVGRGHMEDTIATPITPSSHPRFCVSRARTYTRRMVETRAQRTKDQVTATRAQPFEWSPSGFGAYVSAFILKSNSLNHQESRIKVVIEVVSREPRPRRHSGFMCIYPYTQPCNLRALRHHLPLHGSRRLRPSMAVASI